MLLLEESAPELDSSRGTLALISPPPRCCSRNRLDESSGKVNGFGRTEGRAGYISVYSSFQGESCRQPLRSALADVDTFSARRIIFTDFWVVASFVFETLANMAARGSLTFPQPTEVHSAQIQPHRE
jgi:hypothetical protein